MNDRLDAHYFTAPGAAASERIALLEATGLQIARLGDLARVWDPPRFARAYAAPLERGRPYLRPYDVFDFMPSSSARLSEERNEDLENLVPEPGVLLLTCSGRNLGPVTMADATLAGFALSHDMIRIEADDPEIRHFLLAYLKTPTGQALLRRDKSGSVIDHITVSDVRELPIALVEADVRVGVASAMSSGMELIATSRERLRGLVAAQDARHSDLVGDAVRLSHGWSMSSLLVGERLDAAYYEPSVTAVRRALASSGAGCIGDLAVAELPVRYKRYYVEGEHGRPILSGRQLLQVEPINLRHVSDRSFRDATDYELSRGMTVFGAVGRSEGRQGLASLVTSDRDGWLASNDVMRLHPKPGVHPGRVWLAVSSAVSRLQINALSFGSVIDHMNPWDVEELLVPDVSDEQAAAAETAWEGFAQGSRLVAQAVEMLDLAINTA